MIRVLADTHALIWYMSRVGNVKVGIAARFCDFSFMRTPRVRFTIGSLMIAVAVAGGIGALLRVPNAGASSAADVLIIAFISIPLSGPFLLARRGQRLQIAIWVATLWPLSILLSLHFAWLVAHGFLGHAPGPADNGLVIEGLIGLVRLFMVSSIFSTIICPFLWFFADGDLIAGEDRRDTRLNPILLMPLVWFSVVVVLRWDPLSAVWWIMD